MRRRHLAGDLLDAADLDQAAALAGLHRRLGVLAGRERPGERRHQIVRQELAVGEDQIRAGLGAEEVDDEELRAVGSGDLQVAAVAREGGIEHGIARGQLHGPLALGDRDANRHAIGRRRGRDLRR